MVSFLKKLDTRLRNIEVSAIYRHDEQDVWPSISKVDSHEGYL